jgi:2-phosphoglycolate phosphatase
MTHFRPVLFDLDGTLLDTAQDMAFALNLLRHQHALDALPFPDVRANVSKGAKALVSLGFDIAESDPIFRQHVEDFLAYYARHATQSTQPFAGMESVLTFLEQQQIPWGIVTNKPQRFTDNILKTLGLDTRAGCVVCGDTLPKRKPDPDTILHAVKILNLEASRCVYVGDSLVDVTAAKAAGMPCLVALYGYIETHEDPYSWGADGYIHQSEDIISWLNANPL